MRIAIIGAGLSGLSLAWHLNCSGRCAVTLFDHQGIAGGASGIAAGLMHPYPGQMGMRSFLASEGMDATRRLLKIAQEKSPVSLFKDTGILRYPHHAEMRSVFLAHGERFNDIEPWEDGAFLIRSGMTIFCRPYLQGLWAAAHACGVILEQKAINNLHDLSSFDTVVLAAGAGNCAFAETRALRLELLKGQILKCKIPEGVSFPHYSLIGKGYIAHALEEGFCYFGSTYERGQLSEHPDIDKAQAELIPKAERIYPTASTFPVVDCQAAFRVMRIGHYYPMAGKLTSHVWICTALGSRGLLYHGLLAEKMAEAILSDDPSMLPEEFGLGCVGT